jgi:hypothetical protein
LSHIGFGQTGIVQIQQESDLTRLLEIYSKGNADAKVYTIQIGFGSFKEADKLKEEFALEFPDWSVILVFDSPTYRVHAGRFHNRLDAEREFLEVRKKFPGSLLLRPGDRH